MELHEDENADGLIFFNRLSTSDGKEKSLSLFNSSGLRFTTKSVSQSWNSITNICSNKQTKDNFFFYAICSLPFSSNSVNLFCKFITCPSHLFFDSSNDFFSSSNFFFSSLSSSSSAFLLAFPLNSFNHFPSSSPSSNFSNCSTAFLYSSLASFNSCLISSIVAIFLRLKK